MGEPAWKRLGLKVKNTVNNDPLAIVTVREELNEIKDKKKNNKENKNKNKNKKRKADDNDNDNDKSKIIKKPAKRVKLPKSERLKLRKEKINDIEKDQLHYLRQFKEDKSNWKFSKQKQNWIIKNIKNIPEEYENIMFEYLNSIQGGSRDRVIIDMKKVIEEWNKMVDEAEEQLKKDLEKADKDEDEDKDEDGNVKKVKKVKKQVKQEKPKKKADIEKETPPDYDYAVRAREVCRILCGETPVLKSVDPVDVTVEEETVDVEDHV